jgi:GNAT superfamily N-acetyltransferase
MTWRLPDRVKRLSLPLYRYAPFDLDHLQVMLAESPDGVPVGVVAWEPADPADLPQGKSGLFLHGLYVEPKRQHQGIGSQLLAAAGQAARMQGLDGILVKAQPDAQGFFLGRGLTRLDVEDADRHYPHRFWQSVTG